MNEPQSISNGAIEVQNLKAIESVLSEMWRIAAENEPPAKGGIPSLVRVCLGNVVVVTEEERRGEIAEEMDRLSIRRPSRVLVTVMEREATEGGVRAWVRAVCHRPSPGQPQVCCEQIHLDSGPEDYQFLKGIVSPLLEPDLPSVLWWDRDWVDCPEALVELAKNVGALLFDLEKVRHHDTLRELGRQLRGVEIHDLAWIRMEPWRRELAHVFDDAVMRPMLRRIRQVTISEGDERCGFPASCMLFHGWLVGQLGWKIETPFEEVEGGKRAIARDVDREIELWWYPAGNAACVGRLQSVCIEDDAGAEINLTAAPSGDAISISVKVAESCPLPRCANASPRQVSDIIGASMEMASAPDSVYQRALDRALRLVGI